jgi:hypothetical protein
MHDLLAKPPRGLEIAREFFLGDEGVRHLDRHRTSAEDSAWRRIV